MNIYPRNTVDTTTSEFRGFFFKPYIHFKTRFILLSGFFIVTQSWMFAAASGKLYRNFSGSSQLSAIIMSTLFVEMKPILIQWRTVSN